jgi:excisionase family DNA binding protein
MPFMTTTYRIADAAEVLGVSDDTLPRWIDADRLPAATGPDGRAVSARNRMRRIVTAVKKDWPGTVSSVAPHGSAVRVHLDACGGLIADVTPDSAARLGLLHAAAVWATVEATEISVYGTDQAMA